MSSSSSEIFYSSSSSISPDSSSSDYSSSSDPSSSSLSNPTSSASESSSSDSGGMSSGLPSESSQEGTTYQPQERSTDLPVIPPEQNGTGLPSYTREVFDELGRRSLAMDARGIITSFAYDNATGAMVQRIDDVDPESESVPEGWAMGWGEGTNLVTDYECDDHGRVLRELGPAHEAQLRVDEETVEAAIVRTVQYTVYRDDLHQVWKATGYARGSGPSYTFVTAGSVQLSLMDEGGRMTDEIEAIRASNSGPLSADETFPRARWRKWTHQIHDAWGRLLARRVYHRIPESGEGERNYNYSETCFKYDSMGRQNRVMSPGGTITRTVYDARGLPLGQWVGTNDAGATDSDPTGGGAAGNNMVQVLANEYDNGEDGGDGVLTKTTSLVDDNSANNRVVEYVNDYRGRRVDTITTDGENVFISRNIYDNLDRVLGVDSYHTSVDEANLTGRTRRYYDNEGRVYREETYAVDADTGVSWVALVGEKWYDADGNVVREIEPGSEAITLLTYDSLGRQVMRYLAYEPAAESSSSSSTSSSSSRSSSSSSSSRSSSSSSGSSSSSVAPMSSSSFVPPSSSSSSYPQPSSSTSSSSSSHSEPTPCDACASGEDEEVCATTGHPVRLSNGQIVLDETDLSTRGFVGWAHTRSYGNLLSGEGAGSVGNLWLVMQLSSLIFNVGENHDLIVATRGANTSLWFRPDGGGGWEAMFGERYHLVHNAGRYVLTNPEGYRYVYFDDDEGVPVPLQGQLESYADPYGLVIDLEYNEEYRMVRLNQTDGFQSNAFVYSYLGSEAGANEGQMAQVTLEVNEVPVRQAVYDYYGLDETDGGLRDLKRVTIREYDTTASAWATIKRTAYRYYTTGDSGGFVHGLKYLLAPEGYARMAGAGLDPMSVSDQVLAAYADKYFEYDEARRVAREDVRGGRETYLFSYELNPDSPGYDDHNTWFSKSWETRPDGSTFTVYANKAGRTIVSKLEDAEDNLWFHFLYYNAQGRMQLHAMPSAVASVTEPSGASTALTVELYNNEGLLKIKTYYPATNPATGAVATYLESEGVQEGEEGALEVRRRLTYATHIVGGVPIYPVSSEEVFPEAFGPGVVTQFQFAWYETEGVPESGGLGEVTLHAGNEPDLEDLIVVEQSRTTWNDASERILTTLWQRFDDAEGKGELRGPEGPEPKARRSYTAYWFDGVGRPVATADYGTNGSMELERPEIAPERSDTVLVSTTHYQDEGYANATIDANGVETRWQNDAAGRRIRLIENYITGAGAGNPDANRTTDYAYAPDGGLSRLTLVNAVTGDQVTRFEYGTTLADSQVARSDLLRTKFFPSAANVVFACGEVGDGAQRIDYRYNRLGQATEMRDPNGTVHAYDFDGLGRQTQDRVTVLGAGIDGGVRRIETVYNAKRLLRDKVTSFDNAEVGEGAVLNEVAFEYDALNQLSADRQAHAGAVDAQTPSVLYQNCTGYHNSSRRQYMIYPDGQRVLDYLYGPDEGADDRLSRVEGLQFAQESVPACRYTYMGQGRCVEIAYPQPEVRLSYRKPAGEPDGDAGDPYNGYDRFGRTVDMRWLQGEGDSGVLDRIQYGYDRASNRTWRRNLAATSGGQDQAWTYDGLYQVKTGALGTLNIGLTAIGGTPARDEAWTYDPTGNWRRWQVAEAGTPQLDQSRVNNRDNQITQIDGSCEGIAHDLAGNMILIPPDAEGQWDSPQALVWDAWNRLVAVRHPGGAAIALHAYDGLYRRTMKLGQEELRHYYYNDQWKCVEERAAEPPSSSSSEEPSSSSSSSSSMWYPPSSSQSFYPPSSSMWPSSSFEPPPSSSWAPPSSSYTPPPSSSYYYSSWTPSSSSEELLPQPGAYYNCNEVSSALVDSLGLHNFNLSEPPPTSGSGKCDMAAVLSGSGSDYFYAPSSTVFNPGTSAPLFISLWIKPGSVSGQQVIISKENEYQLVLDQNSGIEFRIATGAATGWNKTAYVSNSFATGIWFQVLAWVLPGQEIGLSVNGGTPTTSSLSTGQSAYNGSSTIYLGYSQDAESSSSDSSDSSSSEGATPFFNGAIDEMAFFNVALDGTQQAALYNGGAGLFYYGGSWGACPGSFGAFSLMAGGGIQPLLQEAGSAEAEVACQYVWGARKGHRDELVLRDRVATVAGSSSSSSSDSSGASPFTERLWCLMDYYDPTSAVSDEGEVVERYRFSAFGLRTILTPSFEARSASLYTWDFAFKGQFLDTDTGYYNYGYRYYSPELGRWLSRDPIGEHDDSNLFSYCKNNPGNKLDLYGLACGSGWTNKIVPDAPASCDFTEACVNHDNCYGTCHSDGSGSKAGCDEQFLEEMNGVAISLGRVACFQWATVYYNAVNQYGQGAYNAAQKEACGKTC